MVLPLGLLLEQHQFEVLGADSPCQTARQLSTGVAEVNAFAAAAAAGKVLQRNPG